MADSTINENKFKVRLIPIASLVSGSSVDTRESQVAFDVTPAFSETRSAEYTPIIPVHMPGAMQVYKHTNSRTFEIGAHLISRSSADALRNMRYLQNLRAWLMPYFGGTDTLSSANKSARAQANYGNVQSPNTQLSQADRDQMVKDRIQNEGVQLRGAPPDILYLYAYSTQANDSRTTGATVNINRVPVVLTNLSITFPEDVDYIPVFVNPNSGTPATSSEPFPRKLEVSLTLVETHSPREYEHFDLLAYKLGNLVNF